MSTFAHEYPRNILAPCHFVGPQAQPNSKLKSDWELNQSPD